MYQGADQEFFGFAVFDPTKTPFKPKEMVADIIFSISPKIAEQALKEDWDPLKIIRKALDVTIKSDPSALPEVLDKIDAVLPILRRRKMGFAASLKHPEEILLLPFTYRHRSREELVDKLEVIKDYPRAALFYYLYNGAHLRNRSYSGHDFDVVIMLKCMEIFNPWIENGLSKKNPLKIAKKSAADAAVCLPILYDFGGLTGIEEFDNLPKSPRFKFKEISEETLALFNLSREAFHEKLQNETRRLLSSARSVQQNDPEAICDGFPEILMWRNQPQALKEILTLSDFNSTNRSLKKNTASMYDVLSGRSRPKAIAYRENFSTGSPKSSNYVTMFNRGLKVWTAFLIFINKEEIPDINEAKLPLVNVRK